MTIMRHSETVPTQLREGVERRIAYLENLMVVTLDFNDGPTAEPDPPHSHPHEQVSYVAEGEIIVVIGEQQTKLGPSDVFIVPPDEPHSIQQLTEHVRLIDCFSPIREDFLNVT